jgi:hypothetical protein
MGLASLMVRLGLDASGYNAGWRQAEGVATRAATNIKSRLAGMFSVAMFTAAAKAVIGWADNIQDLSDDLGISTRTLQEWQYAAAGTRATLEDFARAYEYLAKANPSMSSAQVEAEFLRIAEAFKKGEITLGEMENLLGRGAGKLAGPFANGLKDVANEAGRLGAILSEDQIKAMGEVSDMWEKLLLKAKAYFSFVILGIIDLVTETGIFLGALKMWKGGWDAMTTEYMRLKNEQAKAEQASEEARRKEQEAREREKQQQKSDTKAPITETTIEQTRKWLLSGTTSNQQIGAFNAAQPILVAETKEQTRQLKKIADNTEKLKEELT